MSKKKRQVKMGNTAISDQKQLSIVLGNIHLDIISKKLEEQKISKNRKEELYKIITGKINKESRSDQ